MKEYLAFVLVGLLAISMAGCIGQTKAQTPSQTYITVEDLAGRTVKVPANVSRIVASGSGALRLIVYLNATDKLVGVEDFEKHHRIIGRPYRMAHPELVNLPSIGKGGPLVEIDYEKVVKLKPDVIFVTYVDARTADNIQEKTGIPVVVLSYGPRATFELDKIYKSLEVAGKVLGKEERAKEVINYIESIVDDLSKRTENVEAPKVYVGAVSRRGTHGIESTMLKWPPFLMLHTKNVADEICGEGWRMVDKEKILEWNPDVIFIDEGGLGMVLDDYRKNPEFYSSLKAVKNGNVYGTLPFNFYATNIGTALADAYFIGKVLYPERFKDVDPVKKADEIYTFLVGKPVYEDMAKDWGGFGRIDLDNATVEYSLPTSP
ncbi:hypothetical protein A3L12_07500 [Thermococcus sp. P6]|uniref:iron ABC transporter substrate-binding protein n=1 Tax=Thermococcus sp. P6 TaxID=122420 RepID=UPI000B5A1B47|nr:iron ABC transporter substrate-binding protein [Thermococcus sp. P6]ASJ11150.1 hypothetical protein A3L12_07500 [Thermococcus sp. P6]